MRRTTGDCCVWTAVLAAVVLSVACTGTTTSGTKRPGDASADARISDGRIVRCGVTTCPMGFACDDSGSDIVCEDVDECAIAGACTADRICLNEVGSYRCEATDSPCASDPCVQGQTCRVDGENFVCEDIDECAIVGTCPNGTCINIDPGFRCDDGSPSDAAVDGAAPDAVVAVPDASVDARVSIPDATIEASTPDASVDASVVVRDATDDVSP